MRLVRELNSLYSDEEGTSILNLKDTDCDIADLKNQVSEATFVTPSGTLVDTKKK